MAFAADFGVIMAFAAVQRHDHEPDDAFRRSLLAKPGVTANPPVNVMY
jgi:hypothetical protein